MDCFWWVQDVAVKVFLEQDIKVEALDEFKREVCVCLLHSCKIF